MLGISLTSCNEEAKETKRKIEGEALDPNSSLNTVFSGKIFSVPSPIQTSMMIKELKLEFIPSLLNATENLPDYNTSYKQALNLGVYGTDLGYVAIYGNSDHSIKYLASIQKLTDELELTNAFDKTFLTRFESNLANQDSMLVISSDAFKKADYILKNSNRKLISALILTGGWIESIYLSTELNKLKHSEKIVERIGEQKITLGTIIEILKEYNEKNVNDELIDSLEDLQFSFNQIDFKYIYKAPKTNAAQKITVLNHDLKIRIDTDILNQITMKLRTIRQMITS